MGFAHKVERADSCPPSGQRDRAKARSREGRSEAVYFQRFRKPPLAASEKTRCRCPPAGGQELALSTLCAKPITDGRGGHQEKGAGVVFLFLPPLPRQVSVLDPMRLIGIGS